jgi:hypothetical protein
MIRPVVAIVVAVVASVSSCTLLLPTDQLITPCTNQAECDEALGEGFVCEEQACLPEDEGSASG